MANKQKLTQNELIEKVLAHQYFLAKDVDGWENMRADFSNYDLSLVDFTNLVPEISTVKAPIDLTGAKFDGADLSHTNFMYAKLDECSFAHADLTDANLSGSNLSGSNFSYARLTNANLVNALMTGGKMSGAQLCGADLYYAVMIGIDFSHADLSGANLRTCTFDNCNLTGAK